MKSKAMQIPKSKKDNHYLRNYTEATVRQDAAPV